jgi:hypothetical protein
MIQKLLLVRLIDSRPDLLDQAGVKAIAGDPIPVSPVAWNDESGLSHWGFEVIGLSLKQWQDFEKWAEVHGGVTILAHDGDVKKTLATVGLRINESANEPAKE